MAVHVWPADARLALPWRAQVFMVLLNFLLAIIVDAFSEVKEKTHETVRPCTTQQRPESEQSVSLPKPNPNPCATSMLSGQCTSVSVGLPHDPQMAPT
jgi:hypothetical protein